VHGSLRGTDVAEFGAQLEAAETLGRRNRCVAIPAHSDTDHASLAGGEQVTPHSVTGGRPPPRQGAEHRGCAEQFSTAAGRGGRRLLLGGTSARTTGNGDPGVRADVRPQYPPDRGIRARSLVPHTLLGAKKSVTSTSSHARSAPKSSPIPSHPWPGHCWTNQSCAVRSAVPRPWQNRSCASLV
jgi:hypothetical protein